MPLSEHEQRILEDIERRLQQEDPRFAQQVARASLTSHFSRRIRLGILAFVVGFVMLLLFAISEWVAIAGFAVMLAAALYVYHQLRRLGREHGELEASGLAVPGFIERLADRFRRDERPDRD